MFSKSLFVFAFVLGLSMNSYAHAIITPALEFGNNVSRANVQSINDNAKPCGKTNVGATLSSATPANADRNGQFNVQVQSFNGGNDGSQKIAQVLVDAAGNGNFVPGSTIDQNGDPNPVAAGKSEVKVTLPAGTKCTGGRNNDRCVVAFKTTAGGGFGNCVAVTQSGGGATVAGVQKNANAVKAAGKGKGKGSKSKQKVQAKKVQQKLVSRILPA